MPKLVFGLSFIKSKLFFGLSFVKNKLIFGLSFIFAYICIKI